MIRTKHLKPLRPRILELLRASPEGHLSLRAIRDGLGLARGQTKALQAFLGELGERGKLRYRARHYWLPDVAKTGRTPAGNGKGVDRPPARTPATAERRPAEPAGEEGVFVAHRRGFAFVELDRAGRALFIPPRHGGGALDGDRVQVLRSRDERNRGDGREIGTVSAIVERRRARVRGYLEVDRHELWLAPLNNRLPLMYVGAAPPPASYNTGDLVEAEITAYPNEDDEAPVGRLLRALPEDDSPEQIISHILADRQIEAAPSPAAVQEAKIAAERRVTARGREDLRELPFVTIDGEDARDFDDAVCLLPGEKGGARLLVAIADVAHYVRPGTALDRDAYQRGTSVYLPHRALPMLPEALSTDACSLRPGVPRLTLTCDMTVDGEGRVTAQRVLESVIRSHARLTYNQVQQFFETDRADDLPEPAVAEMLREMRKLAAAFAARRRERGALHLALPELRFDLDESGMPSGLRRVFPTEATRLIEQFMLEANEQVAEEAQRHRQPILYRVHDPPPPDRIVTLQLLLHNAGVSVTEEALSAPAGVADVLERLVDHPRRRQLEITVLKSLSQAQYREQNDGHFGLASPCYTHFTSPIRRYPDLLLHRALKGRMGQGQAPDLPQRAGAHLSDRERNAADAEQQVQRLYRVLLMEHLLGETFKATVSGIAETGLWVELDEPPAEGPVPVETLPFDRYRYDKARQTLRSDRRRREIRVGDQLLAQLARADRESQELEFRFVQWGWEPRADSADSAPATSRGRAPRRGGQTARATEDAPQP